MVQGRGEPASSCSILVWWQGCEAAASGACQAQQHQAPLQRHQRAAAQLGAAVD